ncbi:alpha/beta fold hydrolase [Cohnella lubricantis]|uniref:Alpha/beta fold hydrolase n=1 Tax=Cohnella lubricantis TaxID=2163172 RepID=A0A841THV9_9BACL|nr:alpha/beta fold hydrolase [Cohnella lubricantis]MBB6678820.1 alpha/beta fold hydrolase [Cohnella lubricantis]MBP2117336.1 pimeloyl-ACP methyl ester carboxylesterase [Cohnella lubricantis]
MVRALSIRYEEMSLAATIQYPPAANCQGDRKLPLVVITHGFVGNRIGVDRLFVQAARELAEQGNLVLRFDFAGCGESEGNYGEHGLDSMIEQTRTVLDYALGLDIVDPTRVTLLGHSLGGAVALLTAARDRRVKSLVLWSAVGYPFNDIVRIVGRRTYDEAVTKGAADYLGYSLTPSFFDSLLNHQPFQETQKFSGDVLLVHGTGDEVIPVDYTFLLEKTFWLRGEGRCEKAVIFQANHTYSNGEHKRELFKATAEWLGGLEQRQQEWLHWSI